MENNKRNNDEKDQDNKKKRHFTAAELGSISTSPTEHERAKRSGGDMGTTGTNVSYEGPTSNSPVGTGYNSGQSGTGADTARNSEEDARTLASAPRENETDERTENDKDPMNDTDEKPDTLGTP